MIYESLNETLCIYRPIVAQNTSAKRTYKRGMVYRVKFAQPSTGASVDSTGVVRQRSATLYFNPERSYYRAIDDGFELCLKEGDVIVLEDEIKKNPPNERFVVKSVTTCRFKGLVHHYEAICV